MYHCVIEDEGAVLYISIENPKKGCHVDTLPIFRGTILDI